MILLPPILTICIPTYNRISIVKTVQLLLPQLGEKAVIQIFDNCSDTPVSELLKDYLTDSITIARNKVNVGAAGNIIKCFEYCETEWMWLLSDDDTLAADAVDTILKTIHRNNDIVYIKYNAINIGRPEDDLNEEVFATGQQDFIHKMSNFGNLLFMSSTVCKVREIRKGIKAAYYFTNTFSPQVVFILAYLAINPDAKTLFSPARVVQWGLDGAGTWSEDIVNKSLSDFVFVVQGADERRMLFDKINSYHPYKGPFDKLDFARLVRTVVLCQANDEHDMIADYFASESFKYWASNASSAHLLTKIALSAILLLGLRLPLINKVIRLFLRDHSSRKFYYYNRFSFYNKDFRL